MLCVSIAAFTQEKQNAGTSNNAQKQNEHKKYSKKINSVHSSTESQSGGGAGNIDNKIAVSDPGMPEKNNTRTQTNSPIVPGKKEQPNSNQSGVSPK